MDYREYIGALNENGLLNIVDKEVNWRYEIGEIARKQSTKAVLFNNISEYQSYKLFTGGLASCAHFSLLLQLNGTLTKKEIINELRSRVVNPLKPYTTEISEEGYIWEEGRDVNLYGLPVPWWHPLDGGRYIGTWHVNVSQDPETNIRNVGVYRMQIKGRNYTTISVSPGSHLAMHVKKAEELNSDLQVAVAIGIDEAVVMAAATASPQGVDEYTIAGAFKKKPLQLVRCKTVDLEVPLNAEIVLEGVVRCGIRMQDGPYFDYSGKTNVNNNAFCFEVRAIKRKYNPIFRGMSVGVAGAEDHLLFSILSHLGMVDFHGSALRQKMQNYLLRVGMYRLFQLTGRIGFVRFKR
jgi:UbiD family decarboxylase